MDKLGINIPWLLAQLINVGLLFLLLRVVAYKPILNMLETRKKKIQDSLEYADKVKADAAVQQKEFERKLEEVQRDAAARQQSAQQSAEKERQRILAEAQEEARQIKEQARGELDYERKRMASELREQVVNLSLLAAQKVIGQSMDDNRSRQLVQDFLNEADFGGNGQTKMQSA